METDINKNRSKFLKLSAYYNKNGNNFLLSEGSIKQYTNNINENIDLVDGTLINPIENYDDNIDMLDELHAFAVSDTANAVISDISYFENIPFFNIACKNDTYTIYIYDKKIYYRNADSFQKICDDIKSNRLSIGMIAFDYDNPVAELDYFDVNDYQGATDLIDTLLVCDKIDENVKIRTAPLSSNGNKDDSKLYHDIMYGDKEKNEFEEKVEKETQAAGVDNPIAPLQPPQQESVNIDNTSILHESKNEKTEKMKEKITYNIGDWVIIKENEMHAQVNNIIYDGNGDITLFTIIASNGIAYDLDDLDEIMPDPAYLDNVPGRVMNSQNLTVPRFGEFDIDPETRLVRLSQNEKLPEDYHKDLNGNNVYVYVLKDGRKLCEQPYVANFEDIAKSKKIIRVLDESGETHEYDINKDLEFVDMPWATVIDSEGKPVRSIQIDPTSYVNAAENDLVICKVDGKLTKFPKSRISILS